MWSYTSLLTRPVRSKYVNEQQINSKEKRDPPSSYLGFVGLSVSFISGNMHE